MREIILTQARFRSDALLRPQVKRFREWLVGQDGLEPSTWHYEGS
jgi:hypothetical protein